MRRRLSAVIPAISVALLVAPAALARGGSGSSGFGGFGRGGGGTSGRGFGHGHFFFVPVGGGGGLFLFVLVLVIVFFVLPRLMRWWRGQQGAGMPSRGLAQRERRVELAAAEAAEDDAAFAPERVRRQAAKLFVEIQSAWDARDRARLRELVAPELLAEWERRLDDFDRKGWRNRVHPLGEPSIGYVGLTNRGPDRADRVVVRIDARLRDYVEDSYGRRVGRVDAVGDTSRVLEFWTLAKGAHGNWILQSIEQGAEGTHRLREPIVASPWADEQAIRDEALVEGAIQDAIPAGTTLAEVADLDFAGDGRAAALDLSLADGRFAPDVLEVAARRAVAAWADAIDGNDGPLLALSHPHAAHELLHPGDPTERTRLVVRGLEVRHISIVSLDPAAEPPTMTIDIELAGRRYLEDRDTAAVVAGSQSRAVTFTERWTLALDGSDEQPWRIAAVGAPAGRH